MTAKMTIDRKPLLDALTKVLTVAGQGATLPILTCVLVHATGEALVLTGSDLERTIRVEVPLAIPVMGTLKAAVIAKRLLDTVKGLPADQEITITEAPNFWVTIESGSVKAKLAGLHPDEFPVLPNFDAAPVITLPASTLLTLADRVAFSISTDEARASFTGAFLTVNQSASELEMVTTDGHRLSKSGVKVDEALIDPLAKALGLGLIIPRRAVTAWDKSLDATQSVGLQVMGDDVALTCGNTRTTLRLIPGRFPNFSQVLPAETKHRAIVPRADLVASLKRAANYTAKTGNTRLTIEPEQGLQIHAFDHEIGDFRDSVACEVEGEGISLGYNYRYLLDLLSATNSPTVEFCVNSQEAPSVFRIPGEPSTVYIVMPMQF